MEVHITIGPPVVRGPLSLFPVTGDGPSGPDYITGPRASGTVVVDEVDDGHVPELIVHNTGAEPVLLIEGEILVGAKQDRTLDISVLIPAGTTQIPVSCVEAGRWGAKRAVSRTGRIAPTRVRRDKTLTLNHGGRVDQGAVWDAVSAMQARTDVRSDTDALDDVFAGAAGRVADLIDGLQAADDQRGVLVAVGGRVTALDLFDRPSALLDYWDGLLAGYALEALDAPDVEASMPGDVGAFFEQPTRAEATYRDAAGLGQDVRVDGPGVSGNALEWEGAIVHLSAFAT